MTNSNSGSSNSTGSSDIISDGDATSTAGIQSRRNSFNSNSSSITGSCSSNTVNNATRLPFLSDWMVDVLAGWVSGATAILACQPVDTILTRWQATTATTSALPSLSSTPYRYLPISTWRTVAHDLVLNAGWTGLWRGSVPMMLVVPWQNGLLMGGYGWGTRYWDETTSTGSHTMDGDTAGHTDTTFVSSTSTPDHRSRQLTAIFVGGSTGGVLQSFLMAPIEWIKVSQQMRCWRSSSSSHSTVTLSWTSWMQRYSSSHGLTATLLRDGIPHGVWFVAYDVCKATLVPYYTNYRHHSNFDDNDDNKNNNNSNNTSNDKNSNNNGDTAKAIPVSVSLLSGAVAATIAWIVGYPADLIKTRIQANTSGSHTSLTVAQTARQLLMEADGNIWLAWYRGFGLKLVRSIPASMITFTVYEQVSNVLQRL